jgi:hypothetical protein
MNETVENGNLSFFGVLYFGAISWLTPENIDLGLKVVTGIGAFVSAVLAARYYWYATKEKKQSLKKNESEK